MDHFWYASKCDKHMWKCKLCFFIHLHTWLLNKCITCITNNHMLTNLNLTLYMLNFFSRNINIYLQFSHSSILIWLHSLYGLYGPRCLPSPERPLNLITHSLHTDMTQVVEILMEDKDLSILHSQYYGCWWPSDTRSQGINNHDIDLLSNL